jgi:hypothetical protein
MNLKALDLSKVYFEPGFVPLLLEYLQKAEKLEDLSVYVGDIGDISDYMIICVLDAISRLPVHSLNISGLFIGRAGRDGLVKYIRNAKSLIRFDVLFQNTSNLRPTDAFLDALATRPDIETVTILVDQDRMNLSKLQNFFAKTAKSLVHARINVGNCDGVDVNRRLLIQALKKNDHLQLCTVGSDFSSNFNRDVIKVIDRSMSFECERKVDLSTLIARLRCLSGSKFKKHGRFVIPFEVIVHILIGSLPSYKLGYWHDWTFKSITRCFLDRRTIGKIKFYTKSLMDFDQTKKLRCNDCDLYRSCQQAMKPFD